MNTVKLNVKALIEEAALLASVSNPDVSMVQSNLEQLVESINAEADLREVVLPMVSHSLAKSLRNRLEVEQWVCDYPEIRNETIAQPIFLTGLPRSGTTYFQYLFDPEPSMRMLRYWEGERPCPPPGFAPETIPGRIEWCAEERAAAQQKDSVRAKIAQIHLSDADGPEECLKLIDQTFLNVGHYWTFRVPGYFSACLDEQALLQAYEYHKLALQLLQWRSNKQRWVLKWPCHLVALEQILQVHPEARFVV
ncbi:MAG: sulfotransferase, partial [Actinobacteria bacterium]|nr:sulfotransferase [Actinomycetota bacterium]